MCGIFGFITNETGKGNQDRRRFIENALIAGTVRGDHGAGLFLVKHSHTGEANYVKAATDGYGLAQTKEYNERFGYSANINAYRAAVGHNRAATIGNTSLANTHPFQEGTITLVHNGTLDSTWNLPYTMLDLKQAGIEVDSHVIAYNLAMVDDPADILSKLNGAFVLVWHDSRDNSVNLVRNSKRPIHIMAAGCEDTVLFASEAEMLYWLAKRNNFALQDIVYPKEGTLLKFLPGNTIPQVREIPLYAPPVQPPSRKWSPGVRVYSPGSYSPLTKDDLTISATGVEQLKAMGFKDEELTTMRFVPHQISQLPGSASASVNGVAFKPGNPQPFVARLVGPSYAAIRNCMEAGENWTVVPQAVSYINEHQPLLHVRLVKRAFDSSSTPTRCLGKEKEDTTKLRPDRAGAARPNDWLPGPAGEMVPLYDWLKYTADGCIQCGQMLCADDAESIVWVQGRSKPMCEGCQQDVLDRAGLH